MFEIRICMGSSCFSRGNAANLRAIREYIEVRSLSAQVVTEGYLCQNLCNKGPNVALNGVAHHEVDAATLRILLDEQFGDGGSH